MNTTFDIYGVVAGTGQKLVAALYLPSGLATSSGTTVTGGTVTGASTVPTGSTKLYIGLSENPSSVYEGTADTGGTQLPDTTTRPYTVVVRIVASATDMTSYAGITAAFEASTSVAYTRDVPRTMLGGFLVGGAWTGGANASVIAPVTVGTNNDKTGFKLASDGLDSISVTAPTGPATTLPQMLIQTWRRFFKKATVTSTQLKTYADDDSTILTTQSVSDDGTTQTVTKAA